MFNNREEIINARYPSAQWNDDSVYDLSNWCHGYYNKPQESDPFYYDNGSIIDYGSPKELIKKHGRENMEEVFLKLNRDQI